MRWRRQALVSLVSLVSLLSLLPPALLPAPTSAAAAAVSAELPVVCGRLLQRTLWKSRVRV